MRPQPRRAGISAHRGGAEVAPEGTAAAYRAAILAGVDLVEVDVRRTSEGTFVCAHDPLVSPAVSRLRTESGPDDVRNLDTPTLTLAEVLELAAEHGVGGHVDVKEPGYEAELVAFVHERLGREHGTPDDAASAEQTGRAYFTTGDAASVERLCAAGGAGLLTVGSGLAGEPWWRVLRLIAGDFFPYRRIVGCHARGVAVQFRFCTPWLRWWLRQRGLACLVYTVDGTWSLRRLLRRHGVTAVVTDRPLAALRIREEKRSYTGSSQEGRNFS